MLPWMRMKRFALRLVTRNMWLITGLSVLTLLNVILLVRIEYTAHSTVPDQRYPPLGKESLMADQLDIYKDFVKLLVKSSKEHSCSKESIAKLKHGSSSSNDVVYTGGIHLPQQLHQGQWTRISSYFDANPVYMFKAYLDDRPSLGVVPVIRVLMVVKEKTNEQMQYQYVCHVWYHSVSVPYIVSAELLSLGFQDKTTTSDFTLHMATCPLLSALPVPTSVSVMTSDAKCNFSLPVLPVKLFTRTRHLKEFGMCVIDIEDGTLIDDLVEWVELHKLFGLEEITTYNVTWRTSLSRSFSHYLEEEFIRVHNVSQVVELSSNFTLVNSTQGILLYDCLYRNMYRYKYILMGSVGRFFVPREVSTYSLLMTETNKKLGIQNSAASYKVNGATFFIRPDLADSEQPEYAKTLVYRRRIAVSNRQQDCGLVINARICLKVSKLSCVEVVGGKEVAQTLRYVDADIDPQTFLLHRYANCSEPAERCRIYTNADITEDDTLLKIKRDIIRSVRQGRVLSS